MFNWFHKFVKWNSPKKIEGKKAPNSYLLSIFIGILEDILFWEKTWLSLSFILVTNILFFVGASKNIQFLECLSYISLAICCADGLETWLKYKHRTNFLKSLAKQDRNKLYSSFLHTLNVLKRRWYDFVYLRITNHSKAFLLMNILLGTISITGMYVDVVILAYILSMFASTYHVIAPPLKKAFLLMNILLGTILITGMYVDVVILAYILSMFASTYHVIAPPLKKLIKNVQLNAESDGELENMIPVASDRDLRELSIEPDYIMDERQSLDYWKPEDIPIEEVSNSSDNSSSLATNLSIEKLPGKSVDTSDSSDDDYIPRAEHNEQFQSTLEVAQPSGTWGDSAYNAVRNVTSVFTNMMYSSNTDDNKRKRVSSKDSSDGFEMIDKNDFM